MSALAAQPPEKPEAPITVWTHDFVTVYWTAPHDNGAPITSYTIYLRTADLSYVTELSGCDGSLEAIV